MESSVRESRRKVTSRGRYYVSGGCSCNWLEFATTRLVCNQLIRAVFKQTVEINDGKVEVEFSSICSLVFYPNLTNMNGLYVDKPF